jgi:transcriptional regulator with XRE-family HTH domain
MNWEALGGFVKGFRQERKLTQTQLADAMAQHVGAPISKGTISKIENGLTEFGADYLTALTRALGASPDQVHDIALGSLTADEGERLGRQAARTERGDVLSEGERRRLNNLPPERRDLAVALLRQLLGE